MWASRIIAMKHFPKEEATSEILGISWALEGRERKLLANSVQDGVAKAFGAK